MSINLGITNTPPPLQPVLSDGIFFTFSADTTNTYKFKYKYELYINNQLEFAGKCTPNPYGLGIADLQQVLDTYCVNNPIALWDTTPIYTHQTKAFSKPYEANVIPYFIKVGYEYADSPLGSLTGFTGIGDTIGEPEFTTDTYKVWWSTMGVNGNANNENFDVDPFILSGTPTTTDPTTTGLFLTNSPRYRDIDTSEYYTLGFTNYYLGPNIYDGLLSEPYYVEYTFYDFNGDVISARTYDNITTNGGGPRTDCNNVYQQLYLIDPISGSSYNTLYVGAGPQNIQDFPPNCAQYTVQLFGGFTGSTTPIPVSPTPTPSPTPGGITPTPTPTPSTTPWCAGCTDYTLIYTGSCESLASVTFTNCEYGIPQTIKLTCGIYYNICSCSAPLVPAEVNITTGFSCVPAPTPSPSATPPATPTPSPSVSVFTYLGRSIPDGTDGPDACSRYQTVRSYQGTKALSNLGVGDYLYDSYPTTPTNGSDLWIALKVGGAGSAYSFQVASDGEILNTYTC